MGMSALYYKMQNRYSQADVKSAMNRTVQSPHFPQPICCFAWEQVVELGIGTGIINSILQYFMDENAVCLEAS